MIIKILSIIFVFLFIIYIILSIPENKNYTTPNITKTPKKNCVEYLDIDTINLYLKLLYSNKAEDIIFVKNKIQNICPLLKNDDTNQNVNNITRNILNVFLTNLLSYKEGKTDNKIVNEFCDHICLITNLKVIKN